MKGPMGQLMRQAQQMQDQMKRIQDEIAQAEVTGESGAGMVKITLTGKHQARRVEIDPAALSEDKEFLEDLIAAAIRSSRNSLSSDSAAGSISTRRAWCLPVSVILTMPAPDSPVTSACAISSWMRFI